MNTQWIKEATELADRFEKRAAELNARTDWLRGFATHYEDWAADIRKELASTMTNTAELTQDEKRILIAEALGWVEVTGTARQENVYGQREWMKEDEQTPEGWSGHYLHNLPDYFRDLNACHEMERALGDLVPEYTFHLQRLWTAPLWDRTAEQRAEAFGKTKGLWP